jgi:xanthine phosphoribosyltransferase
MKCPEDVLSRFADISFGETFDLIVAIAYGGVIPAALVQQRLKIPLHLLYLHFRDDNQQPLYEQPQLQFPVDFDVKGKAVLLVEDRVKTGATLRVAKALLHEARKIKTFAVNGAADYSLYNEPCFRFFWRIE